MLDPRYRLVAVQPQEGTLFTAADLHEFTLARNPDTFTAERILATSRGVRSLRRAEYYLFRRESQGARH